MRTCSPLVVALATLPFAPLFAQEPAPAPALPAAKSPEAAALLAKACERMAAVGSGSFRSEEEQDAAIMRGQNLPIGNEPLSLRGGWQGDLGWGDTDDDTFAVRHGRLITKSEAGWKLRARTLASGAPVPFLLTPSLLFQQIAALPAEARQVTHVEGADMGGKPVTILTLELTGEAAQDLALGGALPAASGGMMLSFGGMFGGQMPEKTYSVDLALSVDPTTGDVLRLRARAYEDNPMLANVRFQMAGDGGQDESEPPQPAADGAANDGAKVTIKKGLPDRKPTKTESLVYYKVDFKDLGAANPPALGDAGKRWLGLE